MSGGLRIEGLRVQKDGAPLAALDAQVPPGAALTVMGPSGAGKSTLLAAIAGALEPPFTMTGRIRVDGRDVTDLPTEARRIGMLFQDDLLFPHLTVAENLSFGLTAAVRGRAARRARVAAALRDVGMAGFEDRYPETLSGGQRSRIALMRALLAEPRALLLDEPFGKLDATLRDEVRRLVFGRCAALGLPVLMVTHDAEDAAASGGAVVRIG